MLLPHILLLAVGVHAATIPMTITSMPSPTQAYPYMNMSAANPALPTELSTSACHASCNYTRLTARVFEWYRRSYSTTLTYGLEYVIVNNRTNATRTSMSYYELPSGFTPPPTNAAGTKINLLTISTPVPGDTTWTTFATNITYPTLFTQYASGYNWWGVLPTTAPDGRSVCSWAPYYYTPFMTTSSSYLGIPVHTIWETASSGGGVYEVFKTMPTQTATQAVDESDPRGWAYRFGITEYTSSYIGQSKTSFMTHRGTVIDGSSAIPPGNSDGVLQHCTMTWTPRNPDSGFSSDVGGQDWQSTAYYLTLTSTIHEDKAPESLNSALGGLLGAAPSNQGTGPNTAVTSATAAAALTGSSPTLDLPSPTATAASEVVTGKDQSTSSFEVSATVDGVDYTPSSAQSTVDLSFALPSQDASTTNSQASNTVSFDLGPSKPTSSEDQSVGIDMGFTKSSSAQAQTIGIDTGFTASEGAQAGTSVATPAGDVSVSGEGFNIGIKPTLTGPTLILTEISGQFVLATAGATSAPAASAGSTTGLGGMILSGLGETGSSSPEQPTTAASEPETPGQTSAAAEPDSPEQTTDAGLPVVTTGAAQEPESTAAAAAPTPVEVGGITVSQNSDTRLVVGSQTLEAGSSIIVGSGSSTTAVVLETDGSSTHIVVGTTTAAVPSPAPAEPEATSSAEEEAPSPFIVGGVTASQNSASEIVVGTQTLAPGSSIVIGTGSSTTAVALQTADGTTQLVVGSSTATVPAAAPASTAAPAPAPFEVAGVTVSQNTLSQLVVGSQTLAPGSTITIGTGASTTAIALETSSGATHIIFGSSTAAIPTVAATATAPIIVGSQTLHLGSTLTLGSGSHTTALVLSTDAAGRSAIVVADASTTYTVAAPSAATSAPSASTLPTTGAHLLTTGGTTELAIGATTYTFKTGGPTLALSTRSGTTIVVAGTGSAQSLIAIPTGMADGDASSSSSSATRTTATATATGDGLPSSGLGGGVGWATSGSGAAASGSGAAAAASTGAARRAEAGWVGVGWAVVVAVVAA